jgi:hypothetical protein
MAIYLRKLKRQTYVNETRRINGKVVQSYLGTHDEPSLRLLWRTSRLYAAMRQQHREEIRRIRTDCIEIESAMDLVMHFAERVPTMATIMKSNPQVPRRKRPGQTPMSEQRLNDLRRDVRNIPVIMAFSRLTRKAQKGDQQAAQAIHNACEASPQLTESFADFLPLAKWMVARQFSQNNGLYEQTLVAKVETLDAELKKSVGDDPLLELHAEIVVVAYLDAMRCALHAANRYDNKSDAEHFQRLASRSAKRYEQVHRSFLTARERQANALTSTR